MTCMVCQHCSCVGRRKHPQALSMAPWPPSRTAVTTRHQNHSGVGSDGSHPSPAIGNAVAGPRSTCGSSAPSIISSHGTSLFASRCHRRSGASPCSRSSCATPSRRPRARIPAASTSGSVADTHQTSTPSALAPNATSRARRVFPDPPSPCTIQTLLRLLVGSAIEAISSSRPRIGKLLSRRPNGGVTETDCSNSRGGGVRYTFWIPAP